MLQERMITRASIKDIDKGILAILQDEADISARDLQDMLTGSNALGDMSYVINILSDVDTEYEGRLKQYDDDLEALEEDLEDWMLVSERADDLEAMSKKAVSELNKLAKSMETQQTTKARFVLKVSVKDLSKNTLQLLDDYMDISVSTMRDIIAESDMYHVKDIAVKLERYIYRDEGGVTDLRNQVDLGVMRIQKEIESIEVDYELLEGKRSELSNAINGLTRFAGTLND